MQTLKLHASSIMTSSLLCSPRMGLPISKILLASSSSGVGFPVKGCRFSFMYIIYHVFMLQLKAETNITLQNYACTMSYTVKVQFGILDLPLKISVGMAKKKM